MKAWVIKCNLGYYDGDFFGSLNNCLLFNTKSAALEVLDECDVCFEDANEIDLIQVEINEV